MEVKKNRINSKHRFTASFLADRVVNWWNKLDDNVVRCNIGERIQKSSAKNLGTKSDCLWTTVHSTKLRRSNQPVTGTGLIR